MSDLAVFHARPTDLAFVRDLGRRVAASSISPFRPGEPELVAMAYEQVVDFILTRDHAVLVAVDGDRRAGFALVAFDVPDEVTHSPQAFLVYMAVEPAYQRQGVATDLLDAVKTEARKRHLPYVSLMVTEGNAAARALYDAAGFKTERRLMTVPV